MARSANGMEEAAGTRRELVFQEGNSKKFWNATLSGSSFTVTFGRIGTAGQEQTKEFADEDQAKKAFDKLVAEKVRKGYIDAGGAAAATTATPTAKPAAKSVAAKPAKANARAQDASPAVDGPGEFVPATAAADLSTERSLDLEPTDWARATFRPRQILVRGQTHPFDQQACVARLAKLRTESYGWNVKWTDLNLPPALSPEEAHFWLEAMTTPRQRDDAMQDLGDKLANRMFTGKLSIGDVAHLLARAERGVPKETTLAIANLLPIEDYLELLRPNGPQKPRSFQASESVSALMYGFNMYIYPYLTDAQARAARKVVLKDWDPAQTPADLYQSLPIEYYLAAALGMHDQVYEVTSSWPDDRYTKESWSDHYHRPQDLIFGLGTPELVASEWRRLKLLMRTPEHVRAFLACTEYGALDCVRDSILAETNKEKCEKIIEAFTKVVAPEAAAPMLECKLSCKTPSEAREWLDTHVVQAVAGLVATAGRRGKLADAAIDYLRSVKRQGHADLISAALKGLADAEAVAKVQRDVLDHEEKTYEALTDQTTPEWLKEALAGAGNLKSHKLPAWAAPANVPPLPIGDCCLNHEHVATLLNLLVDTPVGKCHPLLSALRQHVDAHGRDEFAWRLFRAWSEDGSPAKEKWAMMTHLTRALVWGAFDDKGQLLTTFRVTEERDFADVKDNTVSLENAAVVGVLHPLELAEAERSAWGEVLSDYEVVSPFPQFGRAVHTLEPGEEKTDDLTRFHGMKLPAPTLVFTLEKLNWTRGTAMDAGCFDEHSKHFPAADVTAVVGYEGVVGMGYIDPNESLTVKTVQFVSGLRPPSGYGWEIQDVLLSVLSDRLMTIPELADGNRSLFAQAGFNVIATANTRDRGVNEMSAALKRRFNFETVPSIAEISEEMALVEREANRLLQRAGVPVTVTPPITELLVTTFRELRTGKTTDGKGMETLSTVLSTAEAVSTACAAGIHAYFYDDGQLRPRHVVQHLVGTVLKDNPEDLTKVQHYFEHVVKKRGGLHWNGFYEARHELG